MILPYIIRQYQMKYSSIFSGNIRNNIIKFIVHVHTKIFDYVMCTASFCPVLIGVLQRVFHGFELQVNYHYIKYLLLETYIWE